MDDANPGLEGGAQPVYHPVRRAGVTDLNTSPFKQNF